MDRRWHVAGHYDIAAEVLLNQVRVQRVRRMRSFIGRTCESKHTVSQRVQGLPGYFLLSQGHVVYT